MNLTDAQAHRLVDELNRQAAKVESQIKHTDDLTLKLYGDVEKTISTADIETQKLTQEWQFTRGWSRGLVWGLKYAAQRIAAHLVDPFADDPDIAVNPPESLD